MERISRNLEFFTAHNTRFGGNGVVVLKDKQLVFEVCTSVVVDEFVFVGGEVDFLVGCIEDAFLLVTDGHRVKLQRVARGRILVSVA